MTPLKMIKVAKKVRVMFGVANAPGDIVIYITKSEARRLIRDHELPDDDIGSVHISGATASIIFHT